MELIARAKPVHFRIISGGVECTSLDDLFQHFDRKDISDTINDGRLSKWLRNIKENSVADKISEMQSVDLYNQKDLLRVVGAFMNEDFCNIESDVKLIEKLDSGITQNLAISLIRDGLSTDETILMYAFKRHRELIEDIKRTFSNFEKSNNKEVIWIYAKALIDTGDIKEKHKGIKLAEALAKTEYEPACAYIKKNKDLIEITKKDDISYLVKNFIGSSTQEWKRNGVRILKRLRKELKLESYSPVEREAIQLCIFMTRCFNCLSMQQISSALNTNQTFGSLYKVYEFFKIYTIEINGWENARKKYRALNFMPATTRAMELGRKRTKEIIPVGTFFIRMPINPSTEEYMTFVHGILTNLSDLL